MLKTSFHKLRATSVTFVSLKIENEIRVHCENVDIKVDFFPVYDLFYLFYIHQISAPTEGGTRTQYNI